ncbi:MAG: methylmalonyl Co-A mutase-associated GTPase MeaB [Saprospiraceae bacterium]
MAKQIKSALQVQKGVEQPDNLNPRLHDLLSQTKKNLLSVEAYVQGILNSDPVILSQAITLVESIKSSHQEIAQQIIEKCLPHANKSVRIGITGTPGVGKSTFIEVFGQYIIAKSHKVAVLAIDPSSKISKGSILGDKTRMQYLTRSKDAFIRPSAAGEELGGVARKTRETIILCEAAGFDTIIIETVGVGQSETAVHSMCDFFLLLLLPGAGDELQGIKRGIVEMADLIAVNKADEYREMLAKQARAAYQNALHLFPPKENGWIPKAITCSAISKKGIDEIWQTIEDFHHFTLANGSFEQKRKQQSQFWMHDRIFNELKRLFFENDDVKAAMNMVELQLDKGEISPFKAGDFVLNQFFDAQKK